MPFSSHNLIRRKPPACGNMTEATLVRGLEIIRIINDSSGVEIRGEVKTLALYTQPKEGTTKDILLLAFFLFLREFLLTPFYQSK